MISGGIRSLCPPDANGPPGRRFRRGSANHGTTRRAGTFSDRTATANCRDIVIDSANRLGSFLDRGLTAERVILLSLALSAALAWGFVELADEVFEGSARAFDETVFGFFHGDAAGAWLVSSDKLVEAFRDVTALGSYTVLGLAVAGTCGYLMLVGKGREAAYVAAAVLVGVALSHGLKLLFERPRPSLDEPETQVFSLSFPSAHSMMSAVVFLTLGALLSRLNAAWHVKAYVLGIAVFLTLLVGFSRLVLGVHWPTDILAGWAIGASWAFLCWAVLLFLQRHRAVGDTG